MQVMKLERRALFLTLAVFLLVGCGGGDGSPGDNPSPTAAPAPTAPPTSIVRITVPIVNPENGETVEMEVEFDEGAGSGDDPTKEGERGQTLVRVGSESPVILPVDEDGGLSPSIGLDSIECGEGYLISRYIDAPTNIEGCAPPAAMAAQFNQTKDDALATAISVVKECWKKPSCQARIVFQGSMRHCYRTPEGKWFLYTCYEVKVICFTL